MITRWAYASMTAASLALTSRTHAVARPLPPRAAAPPPPAPNAPNSTFVIERFMARPIICVSSVPRGADQRAGHDQHVVVQHEAGRRRREARERVQQRDHDRHVGAADRQHQHDAEHAARRPAATKKRGLRVREQRMTASDDARRPAAPRSRALRAEGDRPPPISSCSLANAIMLPAKLRLPITAENAIGIDLLDRRRGPAAARAGGTRPPPRALQHRRRRR